MATGTLYTKVQVQCPVEPECRPEISFEVKLRALPPVPGSSVVTLKMAPEPASAERAILAHLAEAHPDTEVHHGEGCEQAATRPV